MGKQKSEFLSAFGTSFQVFKAITDEVLGQGGTDADLRALLSNKEKCRQVAALIIEKPIEQPRGGHPYRSSSGEPLETITVPNLSGPELIAVAEKTLDLTYLDPDYAKYDFLRDECEKTYEVMVWKPGREVVPAKEVRTYFKERGFHGNPAAFIAWVTKHNPEGYHATIPEDDRLFRDARGHLHAPNFIRDGGHRELRLYHDVRSRWFDYWAFVAFREIHS